MANSYGNYITLPGMKASATLASKQYYIVKLSSTAGEVKVSASTLDQHIGIVQNDPAAGEPAEVAFVGVCLGVAGSAITLGDHLTSNKTGTLETVAATVAARPIVGRALNTVTTAGDLVTVALAPRIVL